MTVQDAREVTLALLGARAPEATVCPSEVARAMTADRKTDTEAWRDAMPVVHAAIDLLLAEGLVRLSWRGTVLDARDGPYRIGSGTPG